MNPLSSAPSRRVSSAHRWSTKTVILMVVLLCAALLWASNHFLLAGAARSVGRGAGKGRRSPLPPSLGGRGSDDNNDEEGHHGTRHAAKVPKHRRAGKKRGAKASQKELADDALQSIPAADLSPAGFHPTKPWLNRKKFPISEAGSPVPIQPTGVGIVTYIGNDKYVDGGLAMAYSASQSSGCGPGKWCRTGALVVRTLKPENLRRLHAVFDDVIVVNASLAAETKSTPWGTTFNKLHLWGLTRYHAVVFYDADMVLSTSTADYLKRVSLPRDPYWIGALTGGKGYFASGTMVIRPSTDIHAQLLTFYDVVRKNETDKWGFRGINARDGLVLRYFIAGRVVSIPPIPGYHASGSWKPWFNIHGDHSEVKTLAKFLNADPKDNKYAERTRHRDRPARPSLPHFIPLTTGEEQRRISGRRTKSCTINTLHPMPKKKRRTLNSGQTGRASLRRTCGCFGAQSMLGCPFVCDDGTDPTPNRWNYSQALGGWK